MLKNHILIAWRNFLRSRTSSFINVSGLAVGMAVTILIGLWIQDELSFNKSFPNHNRIAQVLTNANYNGGSIGTDFRSAPPYGAELRRLYGGQFKQVLMTTNTVHVVLSNQDKKLMQPGYYFEPGVMDMLSLEMIHGTRAGLQDPHSIELSASTAKAFFGDADPVGRQMTIDNKANVTVTGVYKDIANNTDFSDMGFIVPWQLYLITDPYVKVNNWEQDGFMTFVQLADHTDMQKASAAVASLKAKNIDQEAAKSNPRCFLLPMNDFHLNWEFENGVPTGRLMRFVWMYGIIGFFVLLLACINFMNMATARSEKRAREVGIRKAIGSLRHQLIRQFFMESLLIVFIAWLIALGLATCLLPFFNQVAEKQVSMLWGNPWFWAISMLFILATAGLAGSYPALYLSSFQPVKVLKGTFRAGRGASIPRRVLVVFQFTVSIALAIGVITVFRQIQLGKDRPVGYTREGLITVSTPTGEVHAHMDAVRADLKKTGAVLEATESLNPVTRLGFATNGLEWAGYTKDQNFWIGKAYVAPQYGKTIGWQVVQGRDFVGDFARDSGSMIINETAAKYMHLKNPIGATVSETLFGKKTSYKVVGIVKDMLQQSPYNSVKETIYLADNTPTKLVTIRLNPNMSASKALAAIEPVFHRWDPNSPFEYQFIDEEYAKKFGEEERVSKLAGFFAILAIFISCLGMFGMASFTAEQRTKEIGVRKVLGASVFSLWRLLSREFVILVTLSLLIAGPLAWYFMNGWLAQYPMRTTMAWWIFAVAGMGALSLALCTVSYQAIKAALANPVKSLRTE